MESFLDMYKRDIRGRGDTKREAGRHKRGNAKRKTSGHKRGHAKGAL